MEFKDKFIGFVDMLGFKKLVEATDAGTGMTLTELLEIQSHWGRAWITKQSCIEVILARLFARNVEARFVGVGKIICDRQIGPLADRA